MHHPILSNHNNAPHPQGAQYNNQNNHATHITLGDVVHWCHPLVCAELNGNVVTMWCAPFTLTEMLGDVNHWLMDKHGVFSDILTHGAHLMLVICESQSLHDSPTFLLFFSLSFLPTLFCLCFPCLLRLVHPSWVKFFHTVIKQRKHSLLWKTLLSLTQFQPGSYLLSHPTQHALTLEQRKKESNPLSLKILVSTHF